MSWTLERCDWLFLLSPHDNYLHIYIGLGLVCGQTGIHSSSSRAVTTWHRQWSGNQPITTVRSTSLAVLTTSQLGKLAFSITTLLLFKFVYFFIAHNRLNSKETKFVVEWTYNGLKIYICITYILYIIPV